MSDVSCEMRATDFGCGHAEGHGYAHIGIFPMGILHYCCLQSATSESWTCKCTNSILTMLDRTMWDPTKSDHTMWYLAMWDLTLLDRIKAKTQVYGL